MAKEITRNRCLPARGPVGGERTASCAPARGPVARGPVGGERTASCVPARGPVGGERTAFSMLPRRFRDSRRLAAWLKRVESGRQGVLDAASQTYFTGSESNVRHSGGVRGCRVRLHCCVRASALLCANSCYLHSYKFATVTAVVCICTVVC